MSTAKKLIEQKVRKLKENGAGIEFRYVCLDTGLSFETYDETAQFSPFTGSSSIEPVGVETDELDLDFDEPEPDFDEPKEPFDDFEDVDSGDFDDYDYYGESQDSRRTRRQRRK